MATLEIKNADTAESESISTSYLQERLAFLVEKTDEILREARLDLNQAQHNSEKIRAKALHASISHLSSLRDQLASGLNQGR